MSAPLSIADAIVVLVRALRDAAPANCAPVDVSGPIDRYYLTGLLELLERDVGRAHHLIGDAQAELRLARKQLDEKDRQLAVAARRILELDHALAHARKGAA